jgi:hypothetical protein
VSGGDGEELRYGSKGDVKELCQVGEEMEKIYAR